MRELISVIVPAYNAETFIGRCIESILGQTYQQIELIVINDGSSDRTEEVCNRYASDTRLRVKTIPNGGVSNARNMGLEMASGQWIMFVDSDDYIEPQICEKLYSAAQKEHADMTVCFLVDEDEVSYSSNRRYPYFNSRLFKNSNLDILFRDLISQNSETGIAPIALSGPYCKIIKRDIANQIRFLPDLSIGEDTCFILMVLEKCNSVYYLHECLYHRIIRSDSLFHAGKNEDQRLAKFTNLIIHLYFDTKYSEEVEFLIAKNYLRTICVQLRSVNFSEVKKAVDVIDKYERNIHIPVNLSRMKKWPIPFTSKVMLHMAKCRMFSLLWFIINKRGH